MSEQQTISALDFARKSLQIHGTIAHLGSDRLADVLSGEGAEVRYQLRGGLDARGRPVLDLHVVGSLNLTCQRCLGAMAWVLDAATRFVLVKGESELPEPEDEGDSEEYLVADDKLDVLALVEDEVLLSIPLAPMHADAACAGDIATHEKDESPFKALQGLKVNKR